MTTPADYNHIKEWLLPLLVEADYTIQEFARKVKISRCGLYAYLSDTNRPSEEIMARICAALNRPLEEGLKQYTPRPEGRPVGSGGGVREVSVRGRKRSTPVKSAGA